MKKLLLLLLVAMCLGGCSEEKLENQMWDIEEGKGKQFALNVKPFWRLKTERQYYMVYRIPKKQLEEFNDCNVWTIIPTKAWEELKKTIMETK